MKYKLFTALCVALLALNCVDGLATLWFSHFDFHGHDFVEVSPLANVFLSKGPVVFLIFKNALVGSAVCCFVVARRLRLMIRILSMLVTFYALLDCYHLWAYFHYVK